MSRCVITFLEMVALASHDLPKMAKTTINIRKKLVLCYNAEGVIPTACSWGDLFL